MKKCCVGIIGCGGIANGKHLPTLAKLDYLEVVAFCELLKKKPMNLQRLVKQLNFKIKRSLL